MKLTDQRILITGANRGLGLEIALAYAREGASLMLCARNEKELKKARQLVLKEAQPGAKILIKKTDVSNLKSVETLIKTTKKALGGLDILVANAGVYGPIGPMESNPIRDWVQALEINLLGVLYTCRAAIPHFKKNRKGKIIITSGGGATRPMENFSAYSASKAGVVRLAETLADELKPYHIDVNTIAPGALNTRFLDQIFKAGPKKVGQKMYEASLKQKETGGDDPKRAAALCVFLASPESDGISGKLISAKWDPWEGFPAYREDLASDIYSIRRIVPKDRGMNWGG